MFILLLVRVCEVIFRTYPFKQAICRGNEHAPLLMSIFLDKHHLISSRLLSPTQICSKLYPSSLCIWRMFSDLGMLHKRPSSLCTPTFGLAHSASKMILMFLLVCSDAFLLWEEESRACPDWKKWDNVPPIIQKQVDCCCRRVFKARPDP